jgi:Ser/Thr protein kinase RdoA (MazF antagonist)
MDPTLDQFYSLTPEKALDAIEENGFPLSGRFLQLNSYENRVFSVELDEELKRSDQDDNVVAKFYRPERWSLEAVKEEHDFLFELKDSGLPVVAPLKLENGSTTFYMENIIGAIFPKQKGRSPQELSNDEMKSVGRLVARIHNVGAQKQSLHRPTLDTKYFGDSSIAILEDILSPEVQDEYLSLAGDIMDICDELLAEETFIRIHGDCHKGNLLQTDPLQGPKEFFFVDFDDFCTGPPVYDFWMLFLSQTEEQRTLFIDGYKEFREFNSKSLKLLEPLRGLRMIYYSAWILRRWKDPSFKMLFPDFGKYNYWAEELDQLRRIVHQF